MVLSPGVEDLDRIGMLKALRSFRDQADSADWALIYFAGHGIADILYAVGITPQKLDQIAKLNTAAMAYLRTLQPPLQVIAPPMIPAVPTFYSKLVATLIGMLAGAGLALLLPIARKRIFGLF